MDRVREKHIWNHHLVLYTPQSLTWNLKINPWGPWKRRFLLETIIVRFHVKLWGCNIIMQVGKKKVPFPWTEVDWWSIVNNKFHIIQGLQVSWEAIHIWYSWANLLICKWPSNSGLNESIYFRITEAKHVRILVVSITWKRDNPTYYVPCINICGDESNGLNINLRLVSYIHPESLSRLLFEWPFWKDPLIFFSQGGYFINNLRGLFF